MKFLTLDLWFSPILHFIAESQVCDFERVRDIDMSIKNRDMTEFVKIGVK